MITAVERSKNAKLGAMSATYAPIEETCPESCPLLGHGCYAQKGLVKLQEMRLHKKPLLAHATLGYQEFLEICMLTGKLPLRAHVSGDVLDADHASWLGLAMRMHTLKAGQPAWTYTHRWKEIARASWMGATVLASCHSPEEVADALTAGYAPCVVLPEAHPSRRTYEWKGLKIIPCPAQFSPRTVTCSTCRICSHPEKWAPRGFVLGFQPD